MTVERMIHIAAITAGLFVFACLAVIDHWRQRDHGAAVNTEDVSHDKDPSFALIPICPLVRHI